MKRAYKINYIFSCILFILLLAANAYAQISHGPRQTGDEILNELITKPNKIIVRVGSNGCTDKSSFKVDIKKNGLSAQSPHYILTIIRTKPDECKAIAVGGFLTTFDMEKDFGLTGNYTYSLNNRIFQNEHLIINESKVKNYKYYLIFPKRYVELKDGKFKEGSDPDSYLHVELINHAMGDLDGNGTDDTIAVLASTPMGSGSFFELTALIADTDEYFIRQSKSILLGDRIKINALYIKAGKIILDLNIHKSDDPSCCPSQRVIKQFRLVDRTLVEITE